ncbi:hypothetical protein TrCOL_g10010 [Triparma columacea]|uniref:Ataxin-10 domain-containing protein n=1 Tax=Triparma columacea TaxID=722753 RepID=A0A9W7LBS4_9STRA|nr:hypothetical protein TrCOL_g10010 [Triparma columacea]
MAIMCELKCGESKKRKMVARLIASIYNAMHSLQTDDINPAIYNNSNLIGNVIRMTLPTSSIKDSPSDSEPQDDCTDWSVRLLTYLLSPYNSPYPSIHNTLSTSVITGEHVVLLNAFGGVVDEVLLSSGFRGSQGNDSTSNDATSNDATSNDATSNDATSNDATSNDATSNDASPPPFSPSLVDFFSTLFLPPPSPPSPPGLPAPVIDMSTKFQFLLVDVYGSLLSLHTSYPPLAPEGATARAISLLSTTPDPTNQKHLLKLLSSLLYSPHSRASLGRAGIYAILNATETCKVLGGREYAVACIQNAVKHEGNRTIVEELTAQKAKPNQMMEKMGLNVQVSSDGKVTLTKKDSHASYKT